MANHGAATYGSWSPLGHRSANGRLRLQFKNLELAQCMATANAVCACPAVRPDTQQEMLQGYQYIGPL